MTACDSSTNLVQLNEFSDVHELDEVNGDRPRRPSKLRVAGMAAALAARLSGVSLLNVCDLTPTAHDGLAPPASGARSGTELVNDVVGRAVGCA